MQIALDHASAQRKAAEQHASICAEGADTLKAALDAANERHATVHAESFARQARIDELIAERDELRRRLSRPKARTARADGAAKTKG